jgi:hypothetical protein
MKEGGSMDYCFYYADGKFTKPAPDDEIFAGLVEGEDFADFLKRCGFAPAQTVGDHHGICYEIHERDDQFLVSFDTNFRCCHIVVKTWPDLLSLLALLSPIVLSAALTDQTFDAGGNLRHIPAALPVIIAQPYPLARKKRNV